MPAIHTRPLHTHNLCRIRQFGSAIHDVQRSFRTSAVSSSPPATDGKDKPSTRSEDEETGAMSRKLEQMTEESLENSGARAGKTVEEAGFSDELKKRLEARILDANFRNENVQAFAAASMSV